MRMTNPWIRLHRASLHNPKVVCLSDHQFRGWHNLLLIASDDGELPKSRDIACHLRMSVPEVEQLLCELVDAGLVDRSINGPTVFKMHDWETHQYVSDTSTERVRKFRNKNNVTVTETFHETERNVSVTPSDTDTETYSETEITLAHSSFVKPRAEKVEEQSLKFDLKTTKKGSGLERTEGVVKRAEGLGLPVDQIIETTNANPTVRSRAAYFTTLCVSRLQKQLPGLDEKLIRDALWGKDGKSLAVVTNLLLTGASQ
jgi:hypothetical protein